MADAATQSLDLMQHLPALQVVIPMIGAAIVAMVRRGLIAWFLALCISWVMPVISIALLMQVLDSGAISYALGGWAPPVGIEYRVDVANAFLLVLVSLMGAIVMPYAKTSVEDTIPEERQAWFYSMYLACLCGLLGIAITGDAFNAFVFLEVSSLSTYAMIAMGRDRRALFAAYQYLIMGTIGATLYVIGVGLVFVMTGTLNMVDLAERLNDVETVRPILAALAFFTVGLSLKIALFPLHSWLPNAYSYAPTMATVFLASTATKVAIYLMMRIQFSVFGQTTTTYGIDISTVIMVFSLFAMFGASFVACYQNNVERMLAYSSVAQVGYITLGIAFATQTGLTGGIIHLFNHAVMKGALFMITGLVMWKYGTVKLRDMAGLGRVMPFTMAAFCIAGLSLIGVPGTVGFVSKYYLASAAFETGQAWLAFAIMASSLLAVVYVGRIIEIVWFRKPTEVALAITKKPPLSMIVPIWMLVAACVYFGLDATLTADVAGKAAATFLEGMKSPL